MLPRLACLLVLSIAATPAIAQDKPFAGTALGDAALGTVAGREDIRGTALAEQQSTVTRNSVGDNVRTGDAKISDSAFQNMAGLSILNVNTGNNVAINAAMNVTVAIQPAQ